MPMLVADDNDHYYYIEWMCVCTMYTLHLSKCVCVFLLLRRSTIVAITVWFVCDARSFILYIFLKWDVLNMFGCLLSLYVYLNVYATAVLYILYTRIISIEGTQLTIKAKPNKIVMPIHNSQFARKHENSVNQPSKQIKLTIWRHFKRMSI